MKFLTLTAAAITVFATVAQAKLNEEPGVNFDLNSSANPEVTRIVDAEQGNGKRIPITPSATSMAVPGFGGASQG